MTTEKKYYQRFSVAQRIEHLVLILTFTTLGLTGLAQKYSLWPISQGFIAALGGIELTRIIHRTAAIIFTLEAVYHVVVLGYKMFVLRLDPTMVPGIKDGKDVYDFVMYNLRFKKQAPKMPRYNFAEKVEYWAMIWGTVLMGLTGYMLWNPIAVADVLPGQFIPAAKAAHGAEAVLAVLAILLWHFYNVHIKHLNLAMFNGKLTNHEMEEEHGHELEQIEAGKAIHKAPDRATYRRRMTFFIPAAVVFVGLSLTGLYFVTVKEESALATYPPAVSTNEVYVLPTATPDGQP